MPNIQDPGQSGTWKDVTMLQIVTNVKIAVIPVRSVRLSDWHSRTGWRSCNSRQATQTMVPQDHIILRRMRRVDYFRV